MSESSVELSELLESSSEQVEEVQSSTVAPVDYTEVLNNISIGVFMNGFLLAAILGAVVCFHFFKGV